MDIGGGQIGGESAIAAAESVKKSISVMDRQLSTAKRRREAAQKASSLSSAASAGIMAKRRLCENIEANPVASHRLAACLAVAKIISGIGIAASRRS